MISVIIPVYNVASYIERCAKSLFQQTLQDMELLFVDDCSQDNSVNIIKDLLKSYPHRTMMTRFITMPSNSGQAAVRKQGIIESRGDYVIHCDGDDWVDEDLYERMYNEAQHSGADIVICDEMWEYNTNKSIYTENMISTDGKQILQNWYKKAIGMYCHNKLIKRELYTKYDIYPWDGLNMWEDNGLITRLFYHANNIVQVHGTYYHYNKANTNSISAHYGDKQVEQMIGIAEHLTVFFKNKPDANDYEKTIMAFQFLAKLNLITTKWSKLKRYYTIFPKCEKIIPELDINAFSQKGKIRFLFVKYHCAWLFVLLFKIGKALDYKT